MTATHQRDRDFDFFNRGPGGGKEPVEEDFDHLRLNLPAYAISSGIVEK
jgi:hypothetical protein